jgi:hypothetical protein
MNDEFILISTIALDRYTIKIYRLNSQNEYVSEEIIESTRLQLNLLEVPSEIVEVVQNLPGVVKTQVYDLSNNLLIDSGIVLE